MKKIIEIVVFILFCLPVNAQNSIRGTFPDLAGQQIKLEGFRGFDTYLIAKSLASAQGQFELKYSDQDYGMGYLSADDNKPFFVMLSGDDMLLMGESFAHAQSIEIIKGKENKIFEQYAHEYPRREQALSAWDYLERIYHHDPLFAGHDAAKQAIAIEKLRIKQEDKAFLSGLDPETYVSWYLPVRKLVSLVPTIAQYRTEEIPAAIAAFRSIDYSDTRFYKSGLLGNVIESHFWLIENSGLTLDSVFIEMNTSIDHMIENLVSDEKKFNEITQYLFNLLEKRSLFGSSEYLALKILNEVSCTVDDNFASQLESYRAMKIGNTAPDFEFNNEYLAPGFQPGNAPRKLSDIQSKYTVVVFGSGWCPQCPEELYQISGLYNKWKTHGMEVVFVSLDEEPEVFRSFAGIFPFISICDFQKWESPVVKAWHVFATPTMYLIDDKREILLRPNSARQMDAWVDWYLAGGRR